MFKRIFFLFLLCLFGSVSLANAALFEVDFNDFSGPHWTGVINTSTDTLTIYTWTENDGFPDFWTPTSESLPLVWNAVDSTGAIYDIPDDWDGNLGVNWGFLSPVPLSEMAFNEGVSPLTERWPGWHINKYIDSFDTTIITTNVGTNKISQWLRYSDFMYSAVADEVTITAVVPIPGAVWLLGPGIVGLMGFRKRMQ